MLGRFCQKWRTVTRGAVAEVLRRLGRVQDGLSGDVAALKRAAVASGMKPEDALKLGLPSLTTPEAAARLHALGVPSAMLNGRQPPPGVPSAMAMAGFHEQLLAAAAQQRSEAQGVSLLR